MLNSVNPTFHFPHITDEMVKSAPLLEDVLDDFLAFIGDNAIVGYNNAGFDNNIIYDVMIDLRGVPFSNDYIDVLHAARHSNLEIPNKQLETLSRYYGQDITGEHRALKDCYLTKAVYEGLYRDYGDAIFKRKDNRLHQGKSYRPMHYTAETMALQDLQKQLERIIEDGMVSLPEFNEITEWIENHRDLQGLYPFDRVFNALDKILADGRVDPEELEELQILFSDFADPIQSRSAEELGPIRGKHVCVTGEFDYGQRKDVLELIEQAGGINDKSVIKKTDILVVGVNGSGSWKNPGRFGNKLEAAMKRYDNGENILIIEEKDFIPAILQQISEAESSTDELKEEIWPEVTRELLKDLIKEHELPSGSVYLKDNYGQVNKNKLISHSIFIWEPDFPGNPLEKPGQNYSVVTISRSTVASRPDDLDFTLRMVAAEALQDQIPKDAQILNRIKTDIDSGTVRIRISRFSKSIPAFLKALTEHAIEHYVSKAGSFGCCSHFKDCSDARKCVHPNKLYSKACQYRTHLDAGEIFYGKNRNIIL